MSARLGLHPSLYCHKAAQTERTMSLVTEPMIQSTHIPLNETISTECENALKPEDSNTSNSDEKLCQKPAVPIEDYGTTSHCLD